MSISLVQVTPTPQFQSAIAQMRHKAKPNSQIARNLQAIDNLLENMKNPNFRGHNDKALDRDLAGYRSCYVDADPSYVDPEGASKPSHRLVYEEYRFAGKIYRSPITFDTRNKVYDNARAFRQKQSGIDFMQIVDQAQPHFAKLTPEQQSHIIESANNYDTLRARMTSHKQTKNIESTHRRRARAEAQAIMNGNTGLEPAFSQTEKEYY